MQVVQAAHAAASAERDFSGVAGANFVVAEVRDEERLYDAALRAEAAGIPYVIFEEPGVGHTALCTAPLHDGRRAVFKRYQLLK